MNRLISTLKTFPSGNRLVSLLETKLQLEKEALDQIATAIADVLEETRDGLVISEQLGDVLAELKCIPLKQPLGEFDISFRRDVFILHSRESTDIELPIPYSSISHLANIWLPEKDLRQFVGIVPNNGDSLKLVNDESHIFIHLDKRHPVRHGGQVLNTITMTVPGVISVIDYRQQEQQTKTGPAVELITELLHTFEVPQEKFDLSLDYQSPRGEMFLMPVYESNGGFLFLMKKSICFGGQESLCFPHAEIKAVGFESTQDAYFAFVLCTTQHETPYRLERMPSEEKEGVLEYCKRKNLKIVSMEDMKILSASENNVSNKVEKDGNEVIQVSSREIIPPDPTQTASDLLYKLAEEEESITSEDDDSEAEILPGQLEETEEEQETWIDMLLADADDDYQESEDDDYVPKKSTSKRKREDVEEGRFVKKPWTSDGDDDLVEMESSSSEFD